MSREGRHVSVRQTLRRSLRGITPSPVRRVLWSLFSKLRVVRRYDALRRSPYRAIHYLVLNRERDNFTYGLANTNELSAFLARELGASPADARSYISELEGDAVLARAIHDALRERPDRNNTMPFGRRLGWYCILRVRRPQLVVETGVHDGLGSTALLRALERNGQDGHPGELISFDIDAAAGWLIPQWLRPLHRIVIGDALAELPAQITGRSVDVFIHDSDHRYEHETAEFELMLPHVADNSVLVSDNAHASSAFEDFCIRHGLPYRFWGEEPRDHFYPGAGIGIAFTRRLRRRP